MNYSSTHLRAFTLSPILLLCASLIGCTPPPEPLPQVEQKTDRLVARVASINKEANYALIQRYGRLNVTEDDLLYTVSVDGKTANLKVTGERLGQFIAADIASGDLNIGDAVYLRNLSEDTELNNKEKLNKQ